MKSWLLDGHNGFIFRIACSVLVIVVMGGAGALFGLKLVAGSTVAAATSMAPNLITPHASLG